MKKLLETDHPMFQPLWVRVLIVGLTTAWTFFEFYTGSPFWGVLFGALAAYAGWNFFVTFEPMTNKEGSDDSAQD